MTTNDARLHAPSAARNRDPILDVLRRHLPDRGLVLEVASGSGEHITYLAANLGNELTFQPSDPDAAARASIDAWASSLGLATVRPALALDTAQPPWPITSADAVICINMIHIAPWPAAEGLVRGAGEVLSASGLLYLYGPFRRDGHHTADSNQRFDDDLKSRNPAWGVRDLEAVIALAVTHGFRPPLIETMPANNLSLIFRRADSPRS